MVQLSRSGEERGGADAPFLAERDGGPALEVRRRRQYRRGAERRAPERDALRHRTDDGVEAEHRLDADAEARLDEVQVAARAGWRLRLHQVLERLARAIVRAARG